MRPPRALSDNPPTAHSGASNYGFQVDMCLALPSRIVELLADDAARVELGGVRKEISLALVDDVAVGDYVIVHVGYALARLDPEEAEKTLADIAAAGLSAPPGDQA